MVQILSRESPPAEGCIRCSGPLPRLGLGRRPWKRWTHYVPWTWPPSVGPSTTQMTLRGAPRMRQQSSTDLLSRRRATVKQIKTRKHHHVLPWTKTEQKVESLSWTACGWLWHCRAVFQGQALALATDCWPEAQMTTHWLTDKEQSWCWDMGLCFPNLILIYETNEVHPSGERVARKCSLDQYLYKSALYLWGGPHVEQHPALEV